jgi:hypothetical protein
MYFSLHHGSKFKLASSPEVQIKKQLHACINKKIGEKWHYSLQWDHVQPQLMDFRAILTACIFSLSTDFGITFLWRCMRLYHALSTRDHSGLLDTTDEAQAVFCGTGMHCPISGSYLLCVCRVTELCLKW